MARELFVYWKVGLAQAEAARAAAQQLQHRLRLGHPQLRARLYRRAGLDGGQATLMETYAQDGGITTELQVVIETAAAESLAPFGPPLRHLEVFEALSP